MKTSFFALALLASVAAVAVSSPAMAQDSGTSNWQVRGRLVGVIPQESSTVNIGGKASADNAVTPELDITYFLTDKLGLELIAATSKHTLHYNDTTKVGSAWILPPTLTLTYHPMRGEGNLSPYIGAGINYSLFYNNKEAAGFNGQDMDGGVGFALQAGADYWLNDNWGVNIDVKKIWLNVEADTNLGATPVHVDMDLDPWVVGAGVSYRF